VKDTAVQRFSREVLDEVLKTLSKQGAQPADEAALRSALTPNVEEILNRLQNSAYTDGFFAAKTPVRSHMFKP
jgi:prophage antirepressor-like protein